MSPALLPRRVFEIGAASNFSFLEGASHAEEMIVAASRLGLAGIGIADRNTVAGTVRAHAVAKVGKVAFRPGTRLVFADGTPDVLAFPQSRPGWGRLCRLLSTGNLRAEKGKCFLFLADLLEWGDELMLALLPGTIATDAEAAHLQTLLKTLSARFGNAVHLGLTPRYDGRDRLAFATLAGIAARAGIALIATNQPLYHEAARKPLADVVTAIREHVTLATAGFRLSANAERHLKGPQEMARLFRTYPEAIANTQRFFERLAFSLEELKPEYPDESFPGETLIQTLRRLTDEGVAFRFPDGAPQKVMDQIAYELDLIAEKSYEAYFLTVYRIMEFARSKDILCQGRGSAANSVVCFCLKITEVNPEKTTLLFARFLSTERDEPPDIDVDFEHEKRPIVIKYIYDTYGREHAGLAAAVTTYRARSAGRETAKAFGLSEDVQSALAGSVWGWWTEGLSEEQAKAAGLDMTDPTTQHVLACAGALINFPRHLSQHTGGFVITRDRLDEVVPIMKTGMDDRTMVEWDKTDLDTLGILKIDILALGMLTCLAKAFDLLHRHYGIDKTLACLFKEEEKDGPVYDMICRADTIGVFQIESRAQMSMLPRLRPREFYDLVIEVAIVRPGPIQGNMVHPYLKRREELRKTRKEPSYPKEELKVVLQRTLGVPLFQEQAMQIAITAAGFSPGEADRLRRAMATFKRSGQVSTFQQKVVRGMVDNGYEREFAERCFKQIEGFGEYGFPESHAASFALLVYASSWFKTYYPDIFCTALLNAQPMGFYPPAQLVRDAREHGVAILPVDINHSDWDALLEEDGFDPRRITPAHVSMRGVIRAHCAVRLGFRLVKGLDETRIALLVTHRADGYRSVRDLWLRSGLGRAAIERLADADAFRSIGLDRRAALWEAKGLDAGQAAERLPLFDGVGDADLQEEPAVMLPEMPEGEQVIEDYRALTLSLKAHPVSFLRQEFARQNVISNRDLGTARDGSKVLIAGIVLVRQRPGSAKGVIFMTLEDETGIANAIVWKDVFQAYRSVVMGARLVTIFGKLQRQNGVIHVIAQRLEDRTAMLGLLHRETRRFGASERADEVLRPTVDQRQATRRWSTPRRDDAPLPTATDETVRVLPKGRNFH